jgi:cytochrome bd-type quinol oxidase subunit 1
MSILAKSILLFCLNLLDAQLTLLWVRTNVATEGNGLMARLLDMGAAPFIVVKVLVGAFAAYVLYRCSRYKLARRGLTLVLGLYVGLMIVHAVTGMSALGWHEPEKLLAYLGNLSNNVFALFY